MSDLRELADQRLQAALERTGARNPRDFYRDRLRELKDRDAAAYRRGVDYYESRLIPAVASDECDPLEEWLEYGRFLATLFHEGETVQIDPTGRAEPYERPLPADRLVLHLPTSARERAIPVGLPPQLSPAQRAAYDLLVMRKVR